MAYARIEPGKSDVYVYCRIKDLYYECIGCSLMKDSNTRRAYFETRFAADMLEHLRDHIKYGWLVPATAIERLKEEINDRL